MPSRSRGWAPPRTTPVRRCPPRRTLPTSISVLGRAVGSPCLLWWHTGRAGPSWRRWRVVVLSCSHHTAGALLAVVQAIPPGNTAQQKSGEHGAAGATGTLGAQRRLSHTLSCSTPAAQAASASTVRPMQHCSHLKPVLSLWVRGGYSSGLDADSAASARLLQAGIKWAARGACCSAATAAVEVTHPALTQQRAIATDQCSPLLRSVSAQPRARTDWPRTYTTPWGGTFGQPRGSRHSVRSGI